MLLEESAKMAVPMIPQFDASDLAELPLFANDESKSIYDEILRKRALLEKAQKEVADNVERIQVMEDHMKNVRLELAHTNELLNIRVPSGKIKLYRANKSL